MTIRGNPDRLEEYTALTMVALTPAVAENAAYGRIIRELDSAPSSIAIAVMNHSGSIDTELASVRHVDLRPAAFGFALRQLDHFVVDTPKDRTYLTTGDLELFNALVAARLAHPGETDADVYKSALNSLTGTPAELAAQFDSVIADITKSMNAEDVAAMQDRLRESLSRLRSNNMYRDPPLTEQGIIQQAWVELGWANGDDNIVPAAMVERLETLTDLLGRRQFDPVFTSDFYKTLGPQSTALLPQAITLASWSDYQRTSGHPAFSIDGALMNVDTSLAVASPNLDSAWRDELFKGAVHDGKLNDAFPLLFKYGSYSTAFAQPAGQLGLDVLHGTVTVDRGVGSPGYPHFDVLETDWEARGSILIEAAATNPDAANALLLVPDNVNWLTSNKFGRTGRHPPDWDVVAPSVRELIVAGTVWEGRTHPAEARAAAANVINAAIAAKPGDASKALSPAYGEMVLTYLPDFARSPAMDLTAESRGDYISLGALQAAQFTSLAMHDDASKAAIFRFRDALDLQTVVVGIESGRQMYPPWAQRLANIDGILLSGENGEVFVNAREQDANAKRYNENLDLFQGIGMGVIGLAKFPGSGVVDKVIDKGFEKLKTDYLYEDTNHAEHAGYTTNVATFSAFDHERLVVAEAQLIVDIRAEQEAKASGPKLTADQLSYISHAEEMLGTPYVDALRDAANEKPAAPVDVKPRQLQEWSGNTPLEQGFTDVSNYTDLMLPHDGTALWPH